MWIIDAALKNKNSNNGIIMNLLFDPWLQQRFWCKYGNKCLFQFGLPHNIGSHWFHWLKH